MFEKHNDMFFIYMNFSRLDRKMKYMNSNYNKTPEIEYKNLISYYLQIICYIIAYKVSFKYSIPI